MIVAGARASIDRLINQSIDTGREAESEKGNGTPVADPGALERIAVIAPGGYDADPARLANARHYFEGRGHRVVEAVDADSRHARFSADDDQRLAQLRRVIDAPDIDIAIALRGGYGATRLLPHIAFDAMASAIEVRGKRFVGHSDFTAIQLGLLAKTRAISFAGPMASYDFGGPAVDPYTEAHFWRAMQEGRVDAEFETPHDDLNASGVLWGGNLAMIASLVGTPWMPQVDGGVLFIEDINEQPYRIERMLLQLLHAGILARQRLVLCGDFSGYKVAPYDNGYDVAAAIAYVRSITSVPIVTGFPFGHCAKKLTLAVGAAIDVEVRCGQCRVRQRWDLPAR